MEELGTRFDGLPMEVYYENAEGENQVRVRLRVTARALCRQ